MTDFVESDAVGTRAHASFDQFVRDSAPALTRVAVASTRDSSAAQDLVQDALLEAFRRWDEVRDLERPDLWVRRVLINRCIDRSRRIRRLAALLPALRRRSESSALGDTVAYWDAVAALSPARAKVVTLRSAGEMSTVEIAEVLEMPQGTVSWHLREAREELRVRLEDDI